MIIIEMKLVIWHKGFNLFDNLTVFENINLSLKLLGKSDKTKVETILKDFEIYDLANKKCNTLSGGEKARVSIARAVIKNPKIIFVMSLREILMINHKISLDFAKEN